MKTKHLATVLALMTALLGAVTALATADATAGIWPELPTHTLR